MRACHDGTSSETRLLDSRADVRIKDSLGRTALHYVADQSRWNPVEHRDDRTGAPELIEMLLKNNADVDATGILRENRADVGVLKETLQCGEYSARGRGICQP